MKDIKPLKRCYPFIVWGKCNSRIVAVNDSTVIQEQSHGLDALGNEKWSPIAISDDCKILKASVREFGNYCEPKELPKVLRVFESSDGTKKRLAIDKTGELQTEMTNYESRMGEEIWLGFADDHYYISTYFNENYEEIHAMWLERTEKND